MAGELTHLDEASHPRMVDVGEKAVTARAATATSTAGTSDQVRGDGGMPGLLRQDLGPQGRKPPRQPAVHHPRQKDPGGMARQLRRQYSGD